MVQFRNRCRGSTSRAQPLICCSSSSSSRVLIILIAVSGRRTLRSPPCPPSLFTGSHGTVRVTRRTKLKSPLLLILTCIRGTWANCHWCCYMRQPCVLVLQLVSWDNPCCPSHETDISVITCSLLIPAFSTVSEGDWDMPRCTQHLSSLDLVGQCVSLTCTNYYHLNNMLLLILTSGRGPRQIATGVVASSTGLHQLQWN